MEFTTYRYKFSDEFLKELFNFSKIHQFVDRNTFKDEWKDWCDINDEIISREENKLIVNGYKGDFRKKMYISARYYLRKKSSEKQDPKERRAYTNLSKTILEVIDNQIKECISNTEDKPSDCYNIFISSNKELLTNEMNNNQDMSKEDFYNKVKKTYKNRFFIQKNSLKI
jgi:hypothetical protein